MYSGGGGHSLSAIIKAKHQQFSVARALHNIILAHGEKGTREPTSTDHHRIGRH